MKIIKKKLIKFQKDFIKKEKRLIKSKAKSKKMNKLTKTWKLKECIMKIKKENKMEMKNERKKIQL